MDLETRLNLVKSVGEEIITEQELRELLGTNLHPIAYDGFEPSGQIHIAQGLMRAITVNKLTALGITFRFWVADWFAMLNNKLGGDMEKIHTVGEYFIEVWRACGLDMKHVEFIWTSEFIKHHPEYWETVMRLSMHASVARVLRCGQIMGREESDSNPSAQILYPLMQAADIHHLEADIAQLGMDQRKVNMLARDIFPKLGFQPPIVISHHMLLGLQFKDSDLTGTDRKIALKMSKSNPNSAIFMTDSREDVERKLKQAYCPEGEEQDNPVLEYAKYIVFERLPVLKITRPAKFGGDLKITSYAQLRELYVAKKIHPMDLKQAVADAINELLEPVRVHFSKGRAKQLAEKVKSYQITK